MLFEVLSHDEELSLLIHLKPSRCAGSSVFNPFCTMDLVWQECLAQELTLLRV